MTIKKTVAIKRALVSVFDKSGLEILAKFLKSKGIIRGRYAYFDRDVSEHYYGTKADKYLYLL